MTRLFWLAICGLILPPTAWLNAADDETRVHVRGSDGGPTVGRLIVQDAAAGKGFVYLPSGEIVIRDSSELYETDQLFKPLDHKALGEQLTASGPFQGFKVKQTRNYLYVYQSSDQFQNITARILESMFTPLKRYCDRAGIKTQDPEFPLVVIIFSDHRQMRTYRDLPPSIVAFYEPLSNRVILCEHSQLVEQAPDIGSPQAFSTRVAGTNRSRSSSCSTREEANPSSTSPALKCPSQTPSTSPASMPARSSASPAAATIRSSRGRPSWRPKGVWPQPTMCPRM